MLMPWKNTTYFVQLTLHNGQKLFHFGGAFEGTLGVVLQHRNEHFMHYINMKKKNNVTSLNYS